MEQTKTQLKTLYETGLLEQNKYQELVSAIEHEVDHNLPPWKRLEKIIVCFFADGSEKYTNMTVLALSTFLDKTPNVKVGLLTHSTEGRDGILARIENRHHGRIIHKFTSETAPVSETWNPTQYKLDIAKFTEDGYEDIFWMDSDTYSYGDMTQFLLQFAESKAKFFVVKDHVMFNSEFVENWTRERPLGVIPQACFMGFKSDIIHSFFKLWRNVWEAWISPYPFARFPDPNPSFAGSMFCIEQYALAMALYQFLQENHLGEDAVMLFDRELLIIQHDGRSKMDVVTKGVLSTSGISVSGLNLSALALSGLRLSGLNISGSGIQLSGLGSAISTSGLLYYLATSGASGLNVSSLSTLFSGLNISGLNLSGLNVSGLNISGLNISGLNLSGLNVSGLEVLLSTLLGSSALNLSGISGISGISVEELLRRLGINFSGLNISGLSLAQLEESLKSTGSIQLGGIDFKYLQGGGGGSTSEYQTSNLSLVDRFGNSFIHYYNQNFELFNNK